MGRKGVFLIGGCSVSIIIVFVIMLYLMSTVNPPPLSFPEHSDHTDRTNNVQLVHDNQQQKHDTVFIDDAGLLPMSDPGQYGMGKVYPDEIDFGHSTCLPNATYLQNLPGVFKLTPRRIMPPIWPRATRRFIDTNMHRIMSSRRGSATTVPAKPTVTNRGTTRTTEAQDYRYEYPAINTKTSSNTTSEKPMKRRSVNDYSIDENIGSLLLKVLDVHGKSRVEIKLASDSVNQKDRKGNKIILNRISTEADYEDGEQKIDELVEDTVISILPNDSLVIDDFGGGIDFEESKPDVADRSQLMKSMTTNMAQDMNEQKHNVSTTNRPNELKTTKRESEVYKTTTGSLLKVPFIGKVGKNLPSSQAFLRELDNIANPNSNSTGFYRRTFKDVNKFIGKK